MKPDFLLPITPCTGVVSEIPMHHMHTSFHTYTRALSLSEKTHLNELSLSGLWNCFSQQKVGSGARATGQLTGALAPVLLAPGGQPPTLKQIPFRGPCSLQQNTQLLPPIGNAEREHCVNRWIPTVM